MKSNRSIQLALAMGALAIAPALAAAQTGSTSPPQQRESGTPGAPQGGAQQGGAQQQQGGAHGAAQGGGAQQQRGDQPGASSGKRAQQQQGQGQKKQAMKLQEHISFQVEEGCTYTASVNGRIEPAAAGKAQQPSGGQPGGGSQGRGGTGAQGQTGGAAQGSAGGSQAQAGGAQDRGRDTGGSQAPAGGAQGGGHQAGAAQDGSQARAGAQAGGAQGGDQAGSTAGEQERVKPNLTVSASMSCPNAPELRVTDTLKTDTAVTRSELEGMIARRASIATEKGGRFCMYVPQFELTREKLSGKGIAQLCRVPAADQKQGMR